MKYVKQNRLRHLILYILNHLLKSMLTTVLNSASKNCSLICNNQSSLDLSKFCGIGMLRNRLGKERSVQFKFLIANGIYLLFWREKNSLCTCTEASEGVDHSDIYLQDFFEFWHMPAYDNSHEELVVICQCTLSGKKCIKTHSKYKGHQ